MGLRALRPETAAVRVMSVRDSRCIRVVTPDDHVACGYHEILLHAGYICFYDAISARSGTQMEGVQRTSVVPSQETTHCGKIKFRCTLLFTTWNLRRCDAARLCGVRYGRGLLRTVLIICGIHTRCRYRSKQRIWPSTFQRGQSRETSGLKC